MAGTMNGRQPAAWSLPTTPPTISPRRSMPRLPTATAISSPGVSLTPSRSRRHSFSNVMATSMAGGTANCCSTSLNAGSSGSLHWKAVHDWWDRHLSCALAHRVVLIDSRIGGFRDDPDMDLARSVHADDVNRGDVRRVTWPADEADATREWPSSTQSCQDVPQPSRRCSVQIRRTRWPKATESNHAAPRRCSSPPPIRFRPPPSRPHRAQTAPCPLRRSTCRRCPATSETAHTRRCSRHAR